MNHCCNCNHEWFDSIVVKPRRRQHPRRLDLKLLIERLVLFLIGLFFLAAWAYLLGAGLAFWLR
jgi:hypothetical protein